MICVVLETIFDVVTNNLRDNYMESRHSVDVDEWPPNQPKTVVNVALIHYKGSRTEKELIEISKRHKVGTHAVDKLVNHSGVTKDISKIFAANFTETGNTSGKSPKFILIEGAPGIGKTVLAKKIAYLWAQKELLIDTDILFLLFLRDPQLQSIKTPEQLIQYLSSKRLSEEQLKNCIDLIEELKVGIVMDGFDEYPIQLRKKSFVADLIKGKIFHNSTVVLTSRPTATISLHNKVDRRIEILGFTQEERDKYISKSLDSPEQEKQIQDYLKCQPIINGLIYVPLHLAILLYLFKVQSKLPETLTEMNKSFILHTIYRSLTKDEVTLAGLDNVVYSMKDLPKDVTDILRGLSNLAFIGLQNNKLVFSYAEVNAYCPEIESGVPGAFNGFGLLQVLQHLPKEGAGTTVSFNFLHFTMQEFFAALHVSNTIPCKQQLSLMKKTFWNSMYNYMWMMYVGINGINSQTFVQFLYKVPPAGFDTSIKLKLSNGIKSDRLKCLHLFQCFMEARSKEVPKEISYIFHNDDINFHGLRLLPQHITSLTLYISKYSMQLQSLNLRNCHIGDVGMRMLEHFFTINPDKALSIKHVDLFGNNSVLLWNVYCAIFKQCSLTKLNWSSLGGVNIEDILNVMNNNMIVQSLNLSNNRFNDDDAEKIAEVMRSNTILQELDFSNNDITARGAIAISKHLQNCKLQRLIISWNNQLTDTNCLAIKSSQRNIIDTNRFAIKLPQRDLMDADVQIIEKILCKSKTIAKLNLSQNKISENGAERLGKCIETNMSLKEIDISKNNISNNGLIQMAVALQINKTIQKLNVSSNNISDNGAIAVSECLENNNTLQVLDISSNKITDNGIIKIGEILPINEALRLLNISYNKITDNGLFSFSDCLKKRNKLREIRISWNSGVYIRFDYMAHLCSKCKMNLGDTGASLISAFLCGNIYLQKLNISHNNISDNGAVAVSESFKGNNVLQELNMSSNQISAEGILIILKSIRLNSSLHTLDLTNNIVTKSGLTFISNQCRSLNMSSFLFSYYKIIGNSQNIDTILMHFNGKHDKEYDHAQLISKSKVKYDIQKWNVGHKIKVICSCTKDDDSIEALDVSNLSITSVETLIIFDIIHWSCPLRKLDVSCNTVCDDGAVAISEFLKNNTTLQELNISYNKICNKGIVSIGKALQNNNTLEILNISYNSVSDDGVIIFSGLIKSNNILKQLKISWNDIHFDLNSSVKSFSSDMVLFGNTGAIVMSAFLYHSNILQELNVSNSNISDDGAVAISECLFNKHKLQELNVSHNKVSDKGIINIAKALEFNGALQSLVISHNNISDDGAIALSKYLKNNCTLQELSISHNVVSDNGIISISKALCASTTLQTLDISHNSIFDAGAAIIGEFLKNNKILQKLNISYNKVSNNGIISISKALRMNAVLQTLDISHNNISDNGVFAIGKALRNCTSMDATTEEINNVQSNCTLKELDISHNNLSSGGIITLSNCLKSNNTLQQLTVSWNDYIIPLVLDGINYIFSRSDMHFDNNVAILISGFLSQNDRIQSLDLSCNNISDDGAAAISEYLKKNNALQNLNMSHNEVTSEGVIKILKSIHSNSPLHTVNLNHNIISKSGLLMIQDVYYKFKNKVSFKFSYHQTIESLQQIETVLMHWEGEHYKDCFITSFKARSASYMAKVLCFCAKDNDSVKALDISNHDITGETTKIIAKVIQDNTSLQKLDISRNELFNGAGFISECLENNSTLQELNMSYDKLTNSGVTSISKALQMNATLQVLDISNNDISDDGAVAISECLENNNTLQQLNVSHNKISDIGSINIAKALQINKALEMLDISHNNIPNNGAIAIGKALGGQCKVVRNEGIINADNIQNFTLQKLNLSYNNITKEGIIALSDHLECNNTLRSFVISWNDGKLPVVLNRIDKFYNMSSKHLENIGTILISAFVIQNDTIQKLDISHNGISDDGALAVHKCLKTNKTLQELDISNNKITSDGIIKIAEAIQTNTTLKLLDFSYNSISRCREVVISLSDHLKHNNTLQVLKISWKDSDIRYAYTVKVWSDYSVYTTIATPKWFCKMVAQSSWYHQPCVREFNFDDIEAFLLTALVHNNNDVKLNIVNSKITADAAIIISDFLATNKRTQKLKMSQNTISSKALKLIMKGIKANNTLSKLNISHNNISNDGAVAISECLMNNNILQNLNMSYNNVSSNGIISIGKALQINTALQILDISYNKFDDYVTLCEIPRNSRGIISINKKGIEKILSICHFSTKPRKRNEGILSLSDYLRSNNTLQKLTISWNDCEIFLTLDNTNEFCNISNENFGDTGAILISTFLFQNNKIQKLDISNNNISDDGAVAINKCLETNTSLEELDISNNIISNDGILKIAKTIRINTTLRLLDISHNYISRSREIVTILSDHLKHNNSLQVLKISWDGSNVTYVYTVGINNECYVDDQWPVSKRTSSIVHYIRKYNNIERDRWGNCFNNTLKFDYAEAILLTSLVVGNFNVKKLKIIRSKISYDAAVIISDFLKSNRTIRNLKLSQNIISSEAINKIMKAIQINTTLKSIEYFI